MPALEAVFLITHESVEIFVEGDSNILKEFFSAFSFMGRNDEYFFIIGKKSTSLIRLWEKAAIFCTLNSLLVCSVYQCKKERE